MEKSTMHTIDRRKLLAGAGGAAAAAMVAGSVAASPVPEHEAESRFQASNLPTPREQTLVIETDPINVWDSFNPFVPNGEAYNYGLATVCREYLFYTNFLTGDVTPWLGAEYSYNDDFTECTLTLNPKAKWSDGKPFTAGDVEFSQTMVMKNKELSGNAGMVRDIKSIKATDDQTVVYTLTRTQPRFHYRFLAGIIADGVRIMPQHVWEKQDPGTFKFNPPIQTGPYTLKEASSSKLYYLWEKNPDYWNKEALDPAPQYVLYRQMTEIDASVPEFLAGNLDDSRRIGQDYLNQQQIEAQYDKTSRFDFPDPCPRGIQFNWDSPSGLFKTAEGRWAMSYLIDRETIANTIWQPPSRPATYPWADYQGWQKWAPAEVMDKYDLTFNVDKANEMLDKLGATEKDDDGIRILNGKPLKLTMTTPSQTTGLEYQIGVNIVNSAKEAGIDIELKSLPGSAGGDAVALGTFDINCSWQCGMQFDPDQLYSGFHSRNYVPVGTRTTAGNNERVRSDKLDKQIEILDDLNPDDEKNKPEFDKTLGVFMDELPIVCSIQTIYPMFFNTAVWTGWPTPDDPYTIPANWWGQYLFVLGKLQPANG